MTRYSVLGVGVLLAVSLQQVALGSAITEDEIFTLASAPPAEDILPKKLDARALENSTDANDKYLLALIYHTGHGVMKDDEEAVKYLKEIADKLPKAANALGTMYEFGHGVDKNVQEAALWYKSAADAGDARAKNNLGYLYFRGEGVDKDYQEATRLFQEAAVLGEANGQCNLGWMYQHGYSVERDYKKAAALYKQAADKGLIAAKYNLGYLYQYGLGVPRDIEKSAHLYQLAEQQRSKHAGVNTDWGGNDLEFDTIAHHNPMTVPVAEKTKHSLLPHRFAL